MTGPLTLMGLSPPTRSTSPSSRTRRSLACMATGMSPISSRKSVPPSACSNLPTWRPAAPVKAPFSWPKSSDSISSAGTAAQLRVMKAFSRRGDFSWMARATSSLPVPVSPRIETRVSLAATFSICARSLVMAGPDPSKSRLPRRWGGPRVSSLAAGQLEGIVDREEKLVGSEWLLEKVQSAEARGFYGHFDVRLAGDENDRSLHPGFFEFFEELKTRFTGHDYVRKDEVEVLVADQFGGAEGVVADRGIVTGEAEGAGKGGQGIGVVIDQKKMGFACHADPSP